MIDRLSLANFKAFRLADIPLAPVTLLTGLNSSGKSTVLQAFALLRQSYDSLTLFSSDGDSEQGGFLLNGDLVELGTGQDLVHEDFVRSPGLPTPLIGIRLRTDDGQTHQWTAQYAPEQDVLPLHSASGYLEDGSLFGRCFQYLKADRIVPATSYPRSHHQAIARAFLGARGEHTVNYLRHHARHPMPEGPLRHPGADAHTVLDHVVAWMQELCPGVNLEASEIPGIDSVRLSYGFDGTAGLDSSARRRPTNVGFGLTYALPIVVACLSAGPGSLILLENPEAHLHPRGQSRMAALMAAAAAAGAQLIVETHSDHVLNGLRLAVKNGVIPASATAVHYFRRNGQRAEFVSPQIHDDGTLSDWPAGFFDEWENSLEQLLD
ncbi:AAA family ATPase [Streptomyces sp. HC307]|uniref:AAA family ATPase n=1 Tax=Streptomyces flavusporus TaxID=3385496 RepID=UPI0039172A6E